jgi:predicted acyltransferase
METQLHAIEQKHELKHHEIQGAQRFFSLDVFRGLTICLMIIVNTPGKGAQLYSYLVHAKWLGFTLADLVFPSFLFAVGNAMSFSLKKRESGSQAIFLTRVFRRALIIFLIGYLLYWFPFFSRSAEGYLTIMPFSETRIMGVLQRIAICYLVSALIVYYFSQRTAWIISSALLLMYWGILYVFGDSGKELMIDGNAIIKLDIFLLGESHVYKKDIVPFDPEGILSTFPAIVNVLAGYWVGIFIQRKGKTYECLLYLLVIGGFTILLALGWSLLFPISKKLWTSSFVLFTIGVDIWLLSLLIYWIEIKKRMLAAHFFSVAGKNPLFIYLLSELLYIVLMLAKLPSGQSVFEWISIEVFQRVIPGPMGALTTAIAFMLLCWLATWWLERKKIYIRI